MERLTMYGAAGTLDVLIGQSGPQPWTTNGGGERLVAWLEPELQRLPAHVVVLSELATTPFFTVSTDRKWLNAGKTVDGDEVALIADLAARRNAFIVLPFAERDPLTGVLYDSVMLLAPDGNPVQGTICSGPRVGQAAHTYRKVHLSENRNASPGVHEKYFFRPGDGFVFYETPFGRLGPLICYDRSFPESWRTLRDAGVRVVVVPIATSRPERVQKLEQELVVAAMQNGQFVLAACKGGAETVGGNAETVTYSGGSRVVSPLGDVLAAAPLREGPVFLRCTVDLSQLETYDQRFHYLRDRRPDAYRH